MGIEDNLYGQEFVVVVCGFIYKNLFWRVIVEIEKLQNICIEINLIISIFEVSEGLREIVNMESERVVFIFIRVFVGLLVLFLFVCLI